jgi:hypothetical protein
MVKDTKRMGLMVVNQFLGGQREAASVIQGVTQSVPGIENTYMGAKLVAGSLQSVMQRVIDERNFQNQWQAKNQGDLNGSAEAFNTEHPPQDYAKSVLKPFGLTENGFKSKADIANAVKEGYLTKSQAYDIAKQQFNYNGPQSQ